MEHNELSGKKILVMGGKPRERVDSFRFYVNDIRPEAHAADVARALTDLGADVTLVMPTANKVKISGIHVISKQPDGKEIESAKDLCDACGTLADKHFDAVLQLANIASISCPNPSNKKLQKTDVIGKAMMFQVVGNLDAIGRLQKDFPSTAVVGYDTHQQWVNHGDIALAEVMKQVSDTQLAAVVTQAAPSKASAALKNPVVGKLTGRKVVVNASRTEEYLTSHDIITNSFSGRQGQSIAKVFANMGAEVTLVMGRSHLPDIEHPNLKTIHVNTAREMHAACMKELSSPTDVFIGSAAVADFGSEDPQAIHLREGEPHTLELTENPSIVGGAAHHANRPAVVVSFAAQSPETILEYAQKKFAKLSVDMTVANPIGDGTIASNDPTMNQVFLITKDGIREQPEMTKDAVAQLIADEVVTMLLKKKPIARSDRTDPSAASAAAR